MTKNEHYQDNHQEYQYNNNKHDNYNNNYYYHPEPGVLQLTPENLEEIRVAYEENIGPMTGAVASMIEAAAEHGLTHVEVIWAIEETGLAPRPSPYYLRAILRNWAETGVTVSRHHDQISPNKARKWWKS